MWALVGDIGGTNMRFAAVADGKIVARRDYPSDGSISFPDGVTAFSEEIGSQPSRAVVAAAGTVLNGVVNLTNSKLEISEHVLSTLTTTSNARLLNDFAAAAWSLVKIRPDEITTLRGPASFRDNARLIIGPGTGLGVAGLVWHEGQPVVVPGEGGHIRVAPNTEAEFDIFTAYAKRFPEFAIDGGPALEGEALASGTGLPNLYATIADTDRIPDNKSLFARAKEGSDPAAMETIRIFSIALGAVAGDLSLVFNASGGVFICGGIAVKNPWIFERQDFLSAFVEGGRFTALRASYPLHLVNTSEFGIEGGRNYLNYWT